MRRIRNTFFCTLFFVCILFSSNKKTNFSYIENNELKKIKLNNSNVLTYNLNSLADHVLSNFEISNDIILPSHSTFYELEEGKDIEVSLIVNDLNFENFDDFVSLLGDSNTANRQGIYPPNNLIVSEPMIFRGVLVRQITYIPYQVDFNNNTIKYFNDIDINIEDVLVNQSRQYTHSKKSKLFEPFYEEMIVNYQSSSREEDYQTPSVLYICGGSSINNPYVQELLEWRHKTGYIVNAVSVSDIGGSSSNNVKNYIQNAYQNWENPPEIVGLIGDTGEAC